MEWISDPQIWLALLTLTVLEVVLGIDNIVFISILSSKLPAAQQGRARTLGLGLAMIMRILLLVSISWVIGLTDPLLSLLGQEISGRDIILIAGGLFLLGKATFEIHEKLEGEDPHGPAPTGVRFGSVIVQILLLDMVFSLDSVITAVGMAEEIGVMIAAVVVAVSVMLVSARPISEFVNRHPTVKMLALSFLLLIGFSLVAEGWDLHIPKGYIYFAMGFSIFVEALNLRVRARRVTAAPVEMRPTYLKDPGAGGAVGAMPVSAERAQGG
jgi:predicted tellurium resistance membrane protein TerC